MMPLVYFMTFPSYVDRRRCLLLEKSLHFLCITIYVQNTCNCNVIVLIKVVFNFIVYNLNGPVVIALARKSDVQSSSHARILKKISLPGISLLFIDPCIY